ncbi:MAG: site-specific DNA-methyltransferase [Clostridium sp.]|uniref:site-specific DNA-methyltransferase n=1 Tax=Clostridium sp. TaxID=1506 RepID=UPI0039EA14CE
MLKQGKLELTWVGKYEEKKIEPRILIEDKSKSYGDPNTENMLIHGDNLIALKALEQDFAGRIKCIYIDPPYNTGSAFEHYDDGLEHSEWLCMMKPRLELLRNLLSEDGSIWISIDDDEQAYLKILCDEVFQRSNFVANIIWEKKYSPQNDAKWLSDSHDFIIVYAKNKQIWRPNLLSRTDEMNARYKNPDNDPRGNWKISDLSVKRVTPKDIYEIITPSGRKVMPPDGRSWGISQNKFNELVSDNRIWFGKNGNNVPQLKRFLSEVKEGTVCKTIWYRSEVGDNQNAKREVKAINPNDIFSTPKPEALIERILHLTTNKNDIVIDSFLGSGTTAAVAHKMGRKYIGIELGQHCYTHCIPRLKLVVNGEQGGISKSVGWKGGGGFKFYELAEPLLVKNSKLPIYTINPSYTFDMMAEAICKIECFKYKPVGNFQGKSSENRFIHITNEFVNSKYVFSLVNELGDKESLLVYCTKMQSDIALPDNVEIKKIPKDLLSKCSFESEGI